MEWQKAPDIQKRVDNLIRKLGFNYISKGRVFCYRGFDSKSRAYARIWCLSRIWQQALKISPSYIIEVISEKFDKLDHQRQTEVLIHELLHIPKTFSGALRPHRIKNFRIDKRRIKKLMEELKS